MNSFPIDVSLMNLLSANLSPASKECHSKTKQQQSTNIGTDI